MKDLILSIKDVNEKFTNTPLYNYARNFDDWEDEVSWDYLEKELKLSKLLLIDLKTWHNTYTERYPIQFEIRGLEILLKLREELKDRCRVHYYSDLHQSYYMDE